MSFFSKIANIHRCSKLIAGMVILLMGSCGQSDSAKIESNPEKKALSGEIAGICNTVLNFNDLLGKKPNSAAFVAYAELLESRKTAIDNNFKNELQSISGFEKEWIEFDQLIGDLKKGSTEDRVSAQKRIFLIQKSWVKKFHIE